MMIKARARSRVEPYLKLVTISHARVKPTMCNPDCKPRGNLCALCETDQLSSEGKAMATHTRDEAHTRLDDPALRTSFLPHPLPKNKFPRQETDPSAAYQLVHDELLLDGNSR